MLAWYCFLLYLLVCNNIEVILKHLKTPLKRENTHGTDVSAPVNEWSCRNTVSGTGWALILCRPCLEKQALTTRKKKYRKDWDRWEKWESKEWEVSKDLWGKVGNGSVSNNALKTSLKNLFYRDLNFIMLLSRMFKILKIVSADK